MKRLLRDSGRTLLMILLVACAAAIAGLGATVHIFTRQQTKLTEESVITLAVRQMDPDFIESKMLVRHMNLMACVNAFPGIRVPTQTEAYLALAKDFSPLSSIYPEPQHFSYVVDSERAYTVLSVTCLSAPEYPWGNTQWQVRVRVDKVHATAQAYTGEFAIEDEIIVEGGHAFANTDGKPLKVGEQYLVCGMYQGRTYQIDYNASFVNGSYQPVYVKRSAEEYTPMLVLNNWGMHGGIQHISSPDNAEWREQATKLAMDNNRSVRLFLTGDLRSIGWFHAGRAYLTAGRTFTQPELTSGARVCIISQELAAYNGLEIGDTISLTAYESAVVAESGMNRTVHSERFEFINTSKQHGADVSYTIIGLYSAPLWRTAYAAEGTQDFCQNTVFAPYGSVTAPVEDNLSPYYRGITRPLVLQNVILQNGQGDAFLAYLRENGYPDYLYTIEERNYPQIEKVLAMMSSDSVTLLAISASVGVVMLIVVLALYARSWRTENAILAMLGTTQARIGWRMFGSLAVLTLLGSAVAFAGMCAAKSYIEAALNSVYIGKSADFSAIRVGAFSAEGMTISVEVIAAAMMMTAVVFLLVTAMQSIISARKKVRECLFD